MEELRWIFDGVGTEILIFIAGLFISGTIGYQIGKHKGIQTQIAKANAKQTQHMDISSKDEGKKNKICKVSINQHQVAGDNAVQIQKAKDSDNEH